MRPGQISVDFQAVPRCKLNGFTLAHLIGIYRGIDAADRRDDRRDRIENIVSTRLSIAVDKDDMQPCVVGGIDNCHLLSREGYFETRAMFSPQRFKPFRHWSDPLM